MLRALKPYILTLALLPGISACTPPTSAISGAAMYGAAVTVADPPPDAATAAGNVAKLVQANAAEAVDHANYFGESAKEGFYSVTDHIADWMKPTKPKPPQPITASYCYNVYQDILCYRQPMPESSTRLAGYQPLGAPPPPPVMMQPLPQPAQGAVQPAATRVASTKPVFSKLPGLPAESAKTPEDGAASPETTHEQLPDPASAPEL